MTHYVQIDSEVREATPQEVLAIQQRETEFAAVQAAMELHVAAAESARAKLAALGLTDEEITALVGQ